MFFVFFFFVQHLDLEISSSSLANLATFIMYAVVSQPLNSPEPDYSPPSLLSHVLHSDVTGFQAPQLDLCLCHWLVLLLTHNGRGMTILYQKNMMMHCTVLSLIGVLIGPCYSSFSFNLFCFFLIHSTECTLNSLPFSLYSVFKKLQLQIELMFGGTSDGTTGESAVSPRFTLNTLISFPICQ